MKEFSFYGPKSVDECLGILSAQEGSVQIIAGGTDVLVDMKSGWITADTIVDISQLKDLKYIREEGNYLHLGALTTFTDLLDSPLIKEDFKAIYDTAIYMGSPQIRNLATVGGNLVSASVAGDLATPLLAYSTEVVLKSEQGKRVMDLEDFIKDSESRRCQIGNHELLTEIIIKKTNKSEAVAYRKFGRRKSLAIVVLAMAMYLKKNTRNRVEDARVILGAVGLHPFRSTKIEEVIRDRNVSQEELDAVLPLFTEEIDAAIGNRPSVVYKREAIRGLASYIFEDLIETLRNKEETNASN